jgi:hypothetical protein
MRVHLLKFYLAVLLGLILTGVLSGQEVYPVSVSGGILIRPNSLVLSDYATDRAQDVMFTLQLRDPVELTRDVTLRLTIRNENNEILVTDPNFNFAPVITLEQGIPILIDGIDLAPYFSDNSLVGLNAQMGGGLLPEGYNEFCLEVIDIQRNVPISAAACAGGYFEQSDPPILISPNCGQTLTWSETPNLLFNWNLAFISPNNPPLNVQYEFEVAIVEEGQNPNEAFLFTPFYSEVVSSPTLLFLEGAPALVPNQLYAWRVRAFDDSGTDMFRNNGDSQICTFLFTDFNDTENNNPANFTCDDGSCNWVGDLSSSLPINGSLQTGEQVSIGHFKMELIDPNTTDGINYAGAGTVYVPFLNSKVNVSFTNIKINSARRVYFGDVQAVATPLSDLIPSFFAADNPFAIENAIADVEGDFPDASSAALYEYFNSPEGSAKLTSVLNSGSATEAPQLDLPIGLDQLTDGITDPLALGITNSTDPLVIAITGLTFTANNASLNAVLSTRANESAEWVKFGTKNLCFQPAGLTREDGAKLDLLGSPNVQQDGAFVSLIGLNNEGLNGSSLNWNCAGYEQFLLIPGETTEGQELQIDCAVVPDPIVIDNTEARFEGAMTAASLQLGYFTLRPNYPLVSDDGNGNITGTGTIEVPALGPFRQLNVDFSTNPIGVDPDGRIVAGTVTTSGTTTDVNILETEEQRNARLAAIAQNVEDQTAAAAAAGPNTFFNLPVVLGVAADGTTEKDQGLILTGLVFEPEKAFAEAKVVFDTGDEEYIEFKATGLEIIPNGIAGINLTVGLAQAFPFQPFEELNALTFQPYNEDTNEGSFVKCDCSGFLEFQLQGSYIFDEEDLIPLDGERTAVEATVTINSTAWGDFIGELSGLGDFSFPGLEDFPMTASSAYLDFSKTRNVEDEASGVQMVFAADYYDPDLDAEMLEWQGVFLPEFTVGLPEDLMILASEERPSTLVCENLMFDKRGVTFSLYGENLIDTRLGDWGFGLDSLGIGVVMNTFNGAGVQGYFDMPLFDGELEYGGSMRRDENGAWEFNLSPLTTARLDITPLHAYIELSPSSVITLGKVLDPETGLYKYQPYADLYGKVGFVEEETSRVAFLEANSNLREAIRFVEEGTGEEFNFKPPLLSLYGFKINHPELEEGKSFGLDGADISASISLGSKSLNIDALEFREKSVEIGEEMRDCIGMEFSLSLQVLEGLPALKFDLGVWAKQDPSSDGEGVDYSFGTFTLRPNILEIICELPEGEPYPQFQEENFEEVNNTTSIHIGFLDMDFPLTPLESGNGYRTADLDFSLKEALGSAASALSDNFGVAPTKIGFPDLGDTDFKITSITFYEGEQGVKAIMQAELLLDFNDTPNVTFIGTIPIYPGGIIFNEIKVGLGNGNGF